METIIEVCVLHLLHYIDITMINQGDVGRSYNIFPDLPKSRRMICSEGLISLCVCMSRHTGSGMRMYMCMHIYVCICVHAYVPS